ncbi:hypothetical protein [Shewanella youngdeokensis]|uniref:Uncharacterized protein n=1 Tax=Shewanella youngdeokensis TaxID=2999068 RepID=A0ABZ0K1Q1_9GAMM|nr:hypothetical protein RGE70_02455 [Shewanella sp. DAU334]
MPESREAKYDTDNKQTDPALKPINHLRHFIATLLTFGLWGVVWWWLILRSEGKHKQLFTRFDEAYWSYLIEREQPPAALYPMRFGGKKGKETQLDA